MQIFSEEKHPLNSKESVHHKKIDRILLGKLKKKSTVKVPGKNSIFNESPSTLMELSLYERWSIKATNPFKLAWDCIMELILVYNILTTSYFLAYEVNPSSEIEIVDRFCWALFVVNIPVTILEEKFKKNGQSVKSFKKSLKKYLKSWLIFDIISIIPLGFWGHFDGEYYLRMLRLFKLPIVFNVLDGHIAGFIIYFFSLNKRFSKILKFSFKFKIISSTIKLLIFFIFVVYFLGCFWYWFQNNVGDYKYSKDGENFQSLNSLTGIKLEDLPAEEKALSSSYFILTTISTIGYGDFLSKNIYEMAMNIFVMLFGVTLFGYLTGTINSAMSYFNEMRMTDNIGKLYVWLESVENANGKMPKSLRRKILKYFIYYFEHDRLKSLAKSYWNADESEDLLSINQEYVKELTEQTYYSILDFLFKDILKEQFKYYFNDNNKFFYSIAVHFQPRCFIKDEVAFEKGEEILEVHFILKGLIEIGIIQNNTLNRLLGLSKGKVIGDFYLLTKKQNYFDYVSETFTETFMVPGEVFTTILHNNFKATRSHIIAIFGSIHREIRKSLNSSELKKYSNCPNLQNLSTIKASFLEQDDEKTLERLKSINQKNSEFRMSLKKSSETMEKVLNFRSDFIRKIE